MRKLSVVFVALALVVGFSVNAMAAQGLFYTEKERLTTAPTKELEVYGSIRVYTFWQDLDKENNVYQIGTGATNNSAGYTPASPGGPLTGWTPSTFSDSDLIWNYDDGNSRFGVRFKSGPLGANVEIRPLSASMFRQWNATYDMGWGTFLVGFSWTPAFHPICNECLIGGGGFLTDFGDGFSTTRDAGLQLFVPIKAVNGMLKMALLRPSPSSLSIGANPQVLQLPLLSGSGFSTATNDVDTSIPKLEASLSSAFGPLSFIVSGGFNTFKTVATATNNETKIDSWLAQASASYSAGPFYAKGIGYFGQNLAVYGSPPVPFSIMEIFPSTYDGGQTVSDVDHWGFFAVAGFKFNDMISVEGGWGMKNVSMDKSSGGTIEVDKSAFVLFVPISITPAFVITPEILITDWGKFKQTGQPDIDRGGRNYYGVYWRIDF